MGIIKQLSDEVVAKIAAGEVIERPAYAVKELIENALDAKATHIKIQIEDSGLDKIIITDNGDGMSREDIKLSFLPHTTSKIYSEDQLVGVKSLGFRGEALSSIASISKLTLRSKTKKEKSGTEVIISNSRIKSIKPIGMPDGTQIIVENLFSSVPARKKFLKSRQTEYRHIIDTINSFVLANDNVGFEFTHNSKPTFHFTDKQNIVERLITILGETIANNLVPLKFEDSYINISGFLSRPQVSSTTTNKIYLYINQRRIYDSAITAVIRDAYSNLLEYHDYPVAILFLKLPHELVDVNVHPRKEVVKFIDQQSILSAFGLSVEETLKSNNLTFYNISWKNKITHSPTAQLLKSIVLESEVAQIGKVKPSSDVIQLHNLYLVTETKTGIMFTDQHAAHEAILYRHFVSEFKSQKAKVKNIHLEKSTLLPVSLSDSEVIKQYYETFEKLGFDLEEFGDNVYKINAVPSLLKDLDATTAISEMLDDLREEKCLKDVDKRTNKMLQYLACRSAIKAGQKLRKDDVRKLIRQLQKEDYIYTCPHGRPVKVEISLNEFSKLFYRR